MELYILAKYPFLPETGKYLKSQGIELDDLVSSPAYESAREAGKARVLEAFVEGEIRDHQTGDELGATIEVLSYIVARIIVSCTADELLVQRYALAEAVTIQRRLRTEPMEVIASISADLGLNLELSQDSKLNIHFSDYLAHSSQMRSEEWKLVNQEMTRGTVLIDKDQATRLIQHAIQEKIAGELPLPVNDAIIDVFRPAIDSVKNEIASRKAQYEKESYGKVSFLRLPPCMKKLISMMKKGENVPHVGRFALTAFLHTIGMDNEEIVSVFSSSPDFNEHLARYQIDHITGKSSGIEYLPPECETMKSRGVCFDPDSLCGRKWMLHPLTYYRVKGKKKEREKPEKKKEP
jgi:DNA primase large subunit